MVQATESRRRDKLALTEGRRSTAWCTLAESDVGPIFVIVGNVLREQSPQMALVERNHVIKNFTATTSDPAFSYSILPRAPNRRSDWHYSQGTDGCLDFESVVGVVIEQQKSGRCRKREGFPDLLTDPDAGWMARDIEVQDSSPVMANNEEAVQNAKRPSWHGKEVHRRNCFAVVAKECSPDLSRR
jgi:hypothetical protein